MLVEPLERDNIYAHYDHIKKLVMISYRKTLNPRLTADAYEWMKNLIPFREEIRGAVFDFRDVGHFDPANISSAQRQSTELNRNYEVSLIPAAMIIANAYQGRILETLNSMSPGKERKKIVNSYPEAFQFLRDFGASVGRDTSPNTGLGILDKDGATVYFDEATGTGRYLYYGIVTAEITMEVYQTVYSTIDHYGMDKVHGGVFDFRHVTGFDNSNLRTVLRSSQELSRSYDLSTIPTPLIVGTISQERMVLTAMKVTPNEERKRLVYNHAAAFAFIKEFHEKRAAKNAPQSDSEASF